MNNLDIPIKMVNEKKYSEACSLLLNMMQISKNFELEFLYCVTKPHISEKKNRLLDYDFDMANRDLIFLFARYKNISQDNIETVILYFEMMCFKNADKREAFEIPVAGWFDLALPEIRCFCEKSHYITVAPSGEMIPAMLLFYKKFRDFFCREQKERFIFDINAVKASNMIEWENREKKRASEIREKETKQRQIALAKEAQEREEARQTIITILKIVGCVALIPIAVCMLMVIIMTAFTEDRYKYKREGGVVKQRISYMNKNGKRVTYWRRRR